MPARDPATSPHLPTSYTVSHSPTLPTHSHNQPQTNSSGLLSPSSSAFSIQTHQSQSSLDDTPVAAAQPNQAKQGYFASVLRRVSGSAPSKPAFSPIEAPGGNGAMHDDPAALAEAHAHRRESSADSHSHPHHYDRASGNATPPINTHTGSVTSSRAIRDSTARLASMSFSTHSRAQSNGTSSFDPGSGGFHFQNSISPLSSKHPAASSAVEHRPIHPSHLNPAVATPTLPPRPDVNDADGISPPKGALPASPYTGPSGLSMMLEREKEGRRVRGLADEPQEANQAESVSEEEDDLSGGRTPMPRRPSLVAENSDHPSSPGSSRHASASSLRRYLAEQVAHEDLEGATERTPLLSSGEAGKDRSWAGKALADVSSIKQRMSKVSANDIASACILEPVKALPSVVLGLLLNVLDGVSYGMILFPANAVFVDFGSLGVSMFFMSCIVSQLVFSLGGSIFPGGNGSMMIEAVPFFHILVNTFEQVIGDDDKAIIATTMMAFAFSSILTGLVFFALGFFKLGSLIGYFPRHILVGCIGGVGVFLIETGLEVSRGLKEEGFEYNLATLKLFFNSGHAIALWTIPLALAIMLRVITHFYHHQLIFPAYFFIIPLVFYIVVAIAGWDISMLRKTGWVFDVGQNTQAWWKFYTLFDFRKTDWEAFWAAMPTQLALVFFGILHVPLNVPALGVSLGEDNVKLDRELVAHGVSNLAAGLTGTVPNYLTYVNTVLFYRVGGGSRLSGLMLAAATAAVMMIGPTVIATLPVMVVGALIFVLGIDLVIEAVWDTRHRVNRSEYITIWAIAIGMTVFDFVIGLLFGIILACVFFVVQNSRRRAIRTVFNGSTARSTVRRPRSQRAFIQQVGSQTYVMKLQGFLFFGTISAVEDEIRKLLDLAKWQHNPIRFLIIDFALVHGLDFSSAEAFVRIQRLLAAKDVLLILCGAAPNGLVGTALQGVDLWADREGTRVEVFEGLNDALEWTENAYLTAFYENTKSAESEAPTKVIDFPRVHKPPFSLAESFQNSPRRSHLVKAGGDTLPHSAFLPAAEPDLSPELGLESTSTNVQPLPLLLQTFGAYFDAESEDEKATEFFSALVPYFQEKVINAGDVLWKQNDLADGLYLIEQGCLRATYAYDDHTSLIQETMVAGTIAGDLSTLSETRRNCTVLAEREASLWKLDKAHLDKLQSENGELARRFIKIVLKAVAEEHDVLASHLIAVLS